MTGDPGHTGPNGQGVTLPVGSAGALAMSLPGFGHVGGLRDRGSYYLFKFFSFIFAVLDRSKGRLRGETWMLGQSEFHLTSQTLLPTW